MEVNRRVWLLYGVQEGRDWYPNREVPRASLNPPRLRCINCRTSRLLVFDDTDQDANHDIERHGEGERKQRNQNAQKQTEIVGKKTKKVCCRR